MALKEAMASHEQKRFSCKLGDKKISVAYVKRESVEIDEVGLRKALGARKYDKYTVKKLDRQALLQAIESDDVDGSVVTKYLRTKQNNPYLKYTESKDD